MPHGPRKPTAVKREMGARETGRGRAHTHRDVVPDCGGHGDGIGGGGETTCTESLPSGRVYKVEFERLIRQEIDSRNVGRGFQELSDELGIILSGDGGDGDRGKDEKP